MVDSDVEDAPSANETLVQVALEEAGVAVVPPPPSEVATTTLHKVTSMCRQPLLVAVILVVGLFAVGAAFLTATVLVAQPTEKYAVVLDLGSSGSRIYVVHYQERGGSANLDTIELAPKGTDPYDKKVTPGVSSYADDPVTAGESLKPLLDYGLKKLKKLKADPKDTLLLCYATAGVRMLSQDLSVAVQESVRDFITENYDFKVLDPVDAIRAITGQEEALFDYVSIQHILRLYDEEERLSRRVGALDFGGASVELSFQVTTDQEPQPVNSRLTHDSVEPSFITRVDFADEKQDVYGAAYNGLGHNRAFDGILEIAMRGEQQPDKDDDDDDDGAYYIMPCMPSGSVFTPDDDAEDPVHFEGTGDWEACVQMTRELMDKTQPCNHDRCSFNGMYQPEVEGHFIAMDNFAKTAKFFDLGTQPQLSDFVPATQDYCGISWKKLKKDKRYKSKSKKTLKSSCFQGVFVHELLTYGFGFAETSSDIIFADELHGVPINWALGALRLYLQVNNL